MPTGVNTTHEQGINFFVLDSLLYVSWSFFILDNLL